MWLNSLQSEYGTGPEWIVVNRDININSPPNISINIHPTAQTSTFSVICADPHTCLITLHYCAPFELKHSGAM